jgi:hypothetical protein
METEPAQLAQILEAEIEVGEELRRNLTAQRRAIVEWDAGALLEQIQAREPWLRLLAELEERRRRIFNDPDQERTTLGRIVESWPLSPSDRLRLSELRRRSRELFNALQSEERDLHQLMACLLAHIEAAFASIAAPPAPTYGDSGAADRPRAPSALLHSKV